MPVRKKAPTARVRSPKKNTLFFYKDRVVKVLAEEKGQRSRIEWLSPTGETKRSVVRWEFLRPLAPQLF